MLSDNDVHIRCPKEKYYLALNIHKGAKNKTRN